MNYLLSITDLRIRAFVAVVVAYAPILLSGDAAANARQSSPIRIGLDADMTVLRAGEAIRRGIVAAIERHDALDASDFGLVRYAEGGVIIPMAVP